MLNISEYCSNPCRMTSIPYWKTVCVQLPENILIVHDSDFSNELLKQYIDEPYFRLKNELKNLKEPQLSEAFTLCEASLKDYAYHINECYSDIGISEDELHSYTQRKVYRKDLWLAVSDKASGKIVATGIAELDQDIGEGIIEWIQVSTQYRGRGIGMFLVLELLNRMRFVADFATVSGKCNNPTSPERLYRKCGFKGDDVWHILRRKSDESIF